MNAPHVRTEEEQINMGALALIGSFAARAASLGGVYDNTDRAVFAAEAVWLFARRTGLDSTDEDALTAIQDLVCNLMHLCRLESIMPDRQDFDDLLRMARINFEAECDEEAG
ncbi:hypothetical protein ACQPT2_21205 [Erwinia amylovora]